MIKYDLICAKDHVFESWFDSSEVCDKLLSNKLVECPECGNTHIKKSIMAPNITKKGRPSSDYTRAQEEDKKVMDWVKTNCEDVGDKFPDEVRAMHYGDKEERNIHGTASYEETGKLIDEGINVLPLGPAPKNKPN